MKEIGKALKDKRERMSLSLSDVHKSTKIQEKYLIAIEEGDLDVFKAEVYYKSFLRSYSKYLGFDREEFIELLNSRKGEAKQSLKLEEQLSCNDRKKTSHKKKIFIVVAVIVVIVSMYLYKRMPNSVQPNSLKEESLQSQEEVQDDIMDMQQDELYSKSDTSAVEVLTKQNLEIETKETVWIKVDIDGKTAYEGTLPKGVKRTWEAYELFTLKVGYAPGIKVFFNAEAVDIMSGAVQDVSTVILKKKQNIKA
jgi:cytoskeletal protein RodZ